MRLYICTFIDKSPWEAGDKRPKPLASVILRCLGYPVVLVSRLPFQGFYCMGLVVHGLYIDTS
ncbi:hypothetical protein BDV30DRAFT_201650 [Aspergillus minisclerotigenes]|uniref:Uncharacterized protein n=1 Tax=Aspergillus minisclerotigenes TaxID=656917 RepID=A0A5N6JKP1_9EURO|nr:hypothetical protein BDV30DRAFT_201650 [Aspergillus minisclerotigenes]